MKLEQILSSCPNNMVIQDSFLKTAPKLELYNNIVCMVSGGADSDIMVDILTKLDNAKKIKYVFCSTGLEYQATKDHIKYLETKYDIVIQEIKPVKSIPTSCRKYGIPFISKYISEMIYRLQINGFDFANDGYKSFDELYAKYPHCKIALSWWCNHNGDKSSFNIDRCKYLKDFMIANPPDFKISNKCCYYAKKLPAKRCKEDLNCDLDIVGVRKAENGIRSTQYKNCFSKNDDHYDNYRLVFYYDDSDKQIYNTFYNIKNSDCYEVWGMKRTGCVGCPYASTFEDELKLAKKYEPKMYKAMVNIFGKSYDYKRKYLAFKEQMKHREKQGVLQGQIDMFEILENNT